MPYRLSTTKYLLRFDDLCPTMNWKVWSGIEAALLERNLKPILAVVPDNQDPVLRAEPPAEDFWDHVRRWQERGWTIALHGYQHRYVSSHRGMVNLRRKSEFAGLPAAEQAEKLQRGLEIFNRHGIKSHLWIAPGNSFDAATVALLARFGIWIINDGLFRFPFVCRRDIFWVPQQLFGFRPAPAGVWTVCYHHNQWAAGELRKFREDLDRYGPQISCLDDIDREWAGRRSWGSAFLCTHPRLSSLLIRGELKLAGWQRSRTAAAEPPGQSLSTVQVK